MPERVRERVWAQSVAVSVRILQTHVDGAAVKGLDHDQQIDAAGVGEFLSEARGAACREYPIPGRWLNWWRGTLVDTAYQNLDGDGAQVVDAYDEAEQAVGIAGALPGAQATMHRDDPRGIAAVELVALLVPHQWAYGPGRPAGHARGAAQPRKRRGRPDPRRPDSRRSDSGLPGRSRDGRQLTRGRSSPVSVRTRAL